MHADPDDSNNPRTGRTPPHDDDAERALLGALLLSTIAVEQTRPVIATTDFYRPNHQHIYAAIASLYDRGEPVDPLTVAGALGDNQTLTQIGGTAALVDLQADAPGTTNAVHYAQRVVRAADARRVIAAATAMVNAAYDPGADPAAIADSGAAALAEAITATVGATPKGLYQLSWFLNNRTIERPPWVIPGILRQRWRLMIVAPEGLGKLTTLDTPVPTPSGWSTIGDLRVGDTVFDQHGKPCQVTGLSAVDLAPESYRVVFSNGSEQIACADHQWVTVDLPQRAANTWEQQVLTTRGIRDTLTVATRDGTRVLNHVVMAAGPLDLPEADLDDPPYRFGVHLTETAGIPVEYLRASIRQREALLQGILDAQTGSGSVGWMHEQVIVFNDERIAHDTRDLVATLGFCPRVREVGEQWQVTFDPAPPRTEFRYITAVEPVDPVPMRCIEVDSPDHTYLAGDDLIANHNSMLFRGLALGTAQGIHPFTGTRIDRQRVLMVDCENPDDVILEQCTPIERRLRASIPNYDEDGVWLLHAPEGLNLRKRADKTRLEQAIAAVRPSLVTAGPVYKLFRKDGDSDEDATLDVIHVLDDLRARYGFAIALEHHAPKAQRGVRDLDPFGSSVWFRWPELGVNLAPVPTDETLVDVGRFRRDRVRALWPDALERQPLGSARPWQGQWSSESPVRRLQGIIPATEAMDRELDEAMGVRQMTAPISSSAGPSQGSFLHPDDDF